MPGACDRWWAVTTELEASIAASELSEALQTYALAKFDALATSGALVKLWMSGVSPGLTEFQAKRYLKKLNG
jgi:hypothetical protein